MSNVLTIAGSDCCGGAGVQADLKTFAAHSVYGMSVLVALTAQNTRGVQAVHLPPVAFIAKQLTSIFDDIKVDVIKVGMLANAEIIDCVSAQLAAANYGYLVLDPVMVAKSGDRLLSVDAIASLQSKLLPMTDLITPNIPEAAELLGCTEADVTNDLAQAAQAILAMGPAAVLLKGGHIVSSDIVDTLAYAGEIKRYRSQRIATHNTHGTGCTLSAAIAANISRKMPLPAAIERARTYVNRAIVMADNLQIGSGYGPLMHSISVT